MANLMHRFFKNKSCFSSIQRLTAPSLFTYQKPSFFINSNIESAFEKPDPVSLANPVITVSRNEFNNQPMRFYPSFSMGLCLNPSKIQGLDLAEATPLEEEEDAKEIVIYADSVKKKRKKKMNKHKYRKLRKQLARKT
ncbi:hypothetical protein CARUB_v10027346mg [Capsella rubella]|uniref:Small ribosomal subunit protein mS38 n=1 Tax=Capsella rubella TaxID=81985 RepID=R0GC10_9BRAS|nr:uncharacterized protein LOC17877301 [Capsella rubella]EOA14194.1 hypothetical protein CARUB_v10027346mg [Capsella rubella]